MESYLFYIGKAAVAASAFFLAYLVLFQNRKQFVFNRIYLPVSLALSFVIPLITFTTVQYIDPVATVSNGYSFLPETIQPVGTPLPPFKAEWHHYLFGLYILGTAVFLFHLLLGHYKAIRIIKKSRTQQLLNTQVNITEKDVHPFSFFSKIVISENTLFNPHLEIIVAHEKIHVKEKHTLDILFTEILFLLQWFNPFTWLLKNAVRNNIEYKTDHEIAKTTNAQTYQMAMVALAGKEGVAPFLTALNGSQLKNRIIMMKKKTKNRFALVKQLIALPLLAVLVMGLANREIKTEINYQNESTTAHSEFQNETTASKQTNKEKNTPAENIIVSNKETQTESIPGAKDNYTIQADTEETMILSENRYRRHEPDTSITKKTDISFKLDNRLFIIDGREYQGDIKDFNTNDIKRIDVLKAPTATMFYGEKGKNGVVMIETKTGNKPSLHPNAGQTEIKGKVISFDGRKPIPGATIFFTVNGVKSGTVSNTKGDFIIKAEDSDIFFEFLREGYLKKEFAWDGSKELLVTMESEKNPTIPDKTTEIKKWEKILDNAGIEKYPEGKEPIVIQDGYETLHNANDISNLYNSAIIKSIRYKRNTNIDIRRKELAKNGFIEIKTTLPKQNKKLYIIDGEEVFLKNKKPSVYIYPKQLQKMKELSKEEATQKYGNKAKHGAVEITTKTNTLTSETGYSKTKTPLIVVDGMVTEYKSLDLINPGDIQSINVLKDEQATERYGKKGENGVIEVTMKPVGIYTEIQLRRFIAKEIKYPVLAHKSNLEETVNLSVKIDTKGKISVLTDEPLATDFTLDEIVVVGYKINKPVSTGYGSKNAVEEAQKIEEQLFTDETKRVIHKIPKLDIAKFKGKTVGITVKFILQ
ncbi:hypothetical protein D1164_08320 [Mariniphaga sediminis]|uniref:Peptidase M56 domain-containing protein n=1 Tax=Mariniphaga sediminis TaxID=1628158 RepID=A0A399D0X8_9BACT|nr:M56 family metallopeptidase [Mariniphaga sediminis]RIH65655.1 hypothetical protein D1164_08320 [Mariniphaga sediminis]